MSHTLVLRLLLTWVFLICSAYASRCQAAEVVIVGDTQLRPVSEMISGIRQAIRASIKIFNPADIRGMLGSVAEKENAKVVVALGKTALTEALKLPSSIPVVYGLIVVPPAISRPNTTGFYMATPAREYAELIRTYLHSIKRVAVVGSRHQLNILARGDVPQQVSYGVRSSVEFVNTMRRLDSADAILLLPDIYLLPSAALDQAYLLSFRKGIPLLGISERNVKEGALLALVVDTVQMGKQIGEIAAKAIRGVNLGQIPPSPPRKFDMFLNTATAFKMGIPIPDAMMRMAKRVYQ